MLTKILFFFCNIFLVYKESNSDFRIDNFSEWDTKEFGFEVTNGIWYDALMPICIICDQLSRYILRFLSFFLCLNGWTLLCVWKFKSDPAKMTSVSGCIVTLSNCSSKLDTFTLTDPQQGLSVCDIRTDFLHSEFSSCSIIIIWLNNLLALLQFPGYWLVFRSCFLVNAWIKNSVKFSFISTINNRPSWYSIRKNKCRKILS